MLEKVAFVKTLLPDIRNYILSHPIQNIEVKDNEFDNIVTDIDVTIQNRLEKALIERYPDTSLFGEEAYEHLFTPKMWIIDPIDGTKNFVRAKADYTVSIAYYEDLKPVFGVVYDVVSDDVYVGVTGQGAWMNDVKLNPRPSITLHQAVIDMSLKTVYALERRHHADVYTLSKNVFAHRNLGSASLSLCKIAAGFHDIYVNIHLKLWDYAAARIVLNEVGGVTEFPFESKQDLNLHSVFLFSSSHPDLHQELMNLLFTKE